VRVRAWLEADPVAILQSEFVAAFARGVCECCIEGY
jgi:hypothetical protein